MEGRAAATALSLRLHYQDFPVAWSTTEQA